MEISNNFYSNFYSISWQICLDEESVFDYDSTAKLPYGDSYMFAQNLCNIGDTKYFLPTQQITEFMDSIPVDLSKTSTTYRAVIWGDPPVCRVTSYMGA